MEMARHGGWEDEKAAWPVGRWGVRCPGLTVEAALWWAHVLLITLDWNSYFVRNKFHIFMHIPYGIHHMHTMLIHITLIYMLECKHVHIVAVKAIL